jgi:hypothetical protein
LDLSPLWQERATKTHYPRRAGWLLPLRISPVKVFKFEEKTAISEAALSAFLTSGMLFLLPYCNVDITSVQAINGGLFIAAGLAWVMRMLHKLDAKK